MFLSDNCLSTVIEESVLWVLRTLWSYFIFIKVVSLLVYQGSVGPKCQVFFLASVQSSLCFQHWNMDETVVSCFSL